jgi:hypothetical protein
MKNTGAGSISVAITDLQGSAEISAAAAPDEEEEEEEEDDDKEAEPAAPLSVRAWAYAAAEAFAIRPCCSVV